MAKLSVYYDYYNDQLSPQWMIINFGKGNMDWSKQRVYIPVRAPFKRKMSEEFVDDQLSISIASTELIMNKEKEDCFGIHIPTVYKRLNQIRDESIPFRMDEIEQFVIQVGDIEEIMAMDRNELYAWR